MEQSRAVGVDSQSDLPRQRTRPAVHAIAVPLDPTVTTGDDWKALGVSDHPEAVRGSQRAKQKRGALLFQRGSSFRHRDLRPLLTRLTTPASLDD